MYRLILAVAFCACTLLGQTKKILLMNGDPAMTADLQSVTTKAKVVSVTSANVMQELTDADAFIGEPTPAQVRAGKNLQWVQIMSAGAERVLHLSGGNDLRDSKIVLTNNKVVQGPEIADHALAMLLSLTRGIPNFIAQRQQEVWQARPYGGIELRGKTAVVIGVGGIGSQIAIRANAFGMDVIGVDPEDKPFLPFLKKVVKPDQLNEVLPEADVVFVSAPHTPLSHKMMGAPQFELLKKGSYFIAVSRGGLYDLPSLIKALDSRKLAGAGVDVTDPEPLPKGNALWKFDNAIITPHIAGRSDRDRGRMVSTIKENIARFCDGKPLLNVVDKQKGY